MNGSVRKRERVADDIYDRFVDAIVTGHLKSGEKLPTMQRIAAENGVTFRVARGVVERLAREGYVRSCPHSGTVVRAKKHTVWRGRVVFVSFDDDCASYFVSRVADALRRRFVAEGYLLSSVVASRSSRGDVSQLKTMLGQSVDFVVLMYAAPHLKRLVAASGVPFAVIYDDAPSATNAWTIPLDMTEPLYVLVDQCQRARVESVTEVRFKGGEAPSAAAELKAAGIAVRQLVVKPDSVYGRPEGIERAAMKAFLEMQKADYPDVFVFWDDFVAQGALTALLGKGVRIPEDVKVVVQSNKGLGPVFPQSLTRIECDGTSVGEKVAAFVLGVLAKGRLPPVPRLSPAYVFGKSFPWVQSCG